MTDYRITVQENVSTVTVVDENEPTVTVTEELINITSADQGPQGIPGPTGPQGPSGTGDKTFSQSFTNQTSQVVVHNLGKYPDVTFQDTAGTVYLVSVSYDSLNQCTVSWNGSLSGTIICN